MINNIQPYRSSVVLVGSVPLGGDNPIRIQSMTNTDTLDTKASVAQCIRIIEAGADFVRLTAQGIKEAENLANIKRELSLAGFNRPLIADIHFNPLVAERAAAIVEKIRINPGNYVDKRASFKSVRLSDKEYNEELEKIHSKLLPLIKICTRNNTVIRIGVNHGSLSDRIMTRFGNTPMGMAVSAMEFIKIFRAENFNDLVLSMKSSDTAIMIESTRTLVRMMQKEDYSYPIHIGVTESGEGEDGRVRSAAGIGTLLSEGIGDTIRVSLSEDPENEIPVARKIVDFMPREFSHEKAEKPVMFKTPTIIPQIFRKLNGPLVIANMSEYVSMDRDAYADAGYMPGDTPDKYVKGPNAPDIIISRSSPENIPSTVLLALPYKIWYINKEKDNVFPLFSPETYSETRVHSDKLNLVLTGSHFNINLVKRLDPSNCILIFTYNPIKEKFAVDKFMNALTDNEINISLVINPVFYEDEIENLQVWAAAALGKWVIERRIAGIAVQNKGTIPFREVNTICFSILQATETRITRTIFISCPTCGRTKFDLQEEIRKVKEKTGNIKGLKIAIMGCIVNGPGEMAGSDWGYVGASKGRVHIYKGLDPVLKNIPITTAADELLRLIEEDQASR
jgi:(E)-4-hydroxy-3-methylbut-2-enyl-diphosphate synthase